LTLVHQSQIVHHDLAHLLQVVRGLPAPVPPSIAVVKHLWPRVSYEEAVGHPPGSLTDRLPAVRPVGDLQVWHQFTDFPEQLLGCEVHGGDVVGAQLEFLRRSLHHLHESAQAVGDVDHGQPRVGLEVAAELPFPQGVVKHLYCVFIRTCGSASGFRVIGDNTREAETAEVEAKLVVVLFVISKPQAFRQTNPHYLPQKLGVDFGDSVNGPWTLDTQVRRRVARRVRPEGADGAGNEEAQPILLAQFHDVVDAFHVDAHGERHVALADGRQEGAEVDEPVHPLVDHNLLEVLEVQDVRKYDPLTLVEHFLGRPDDVGHDDVILAILLP
ncbi:unnamed protein product, partial [Ixodes hexagonus]